MRHWNIIFLIWKYPFNTILQLLSNKHGNKVVLHSFHAFMRRTNRSNEHTHTHTAFSLSWFCKFAKVFNSAIFRSFKHETPMKRLIKYIPLSTMSFSKCKHEFLMQFPVITGWFRNSLMWINQNYFQLKLRKYVVLKVYNSRTHTQKVVEQTKKKTQLTEIKMSEFNWCGMMMAMFSFSFCFCFKWIDCHKIRIKHAHWYMHRKFKIKKKDIVLLFFYFSSSFFTVVFEQRNWTPHVVAHNGTSHITLWWYLLV